MLTELQLRHMNALQQGCGIIDIVTHPVLLQLTEKSAPKVGLSLPSISDLAIFVSNCLPTALSPHWVEDWPP